MATIKRLIYTFTFYVLLFTYYVFPANAASFKMSPSSATFNQSCNSSVNILLDTENGVSNAADIIVKYDSTKIDVTQVKPGNVYGNYFGNIIDPNAGTIRLTGATFNGTFNGNGVFATIIFKPKTSVGNSSFDIYYTGPNPYNSLDSNIADALTSNDLLSTTQNGFYAFSSGACATDNLPPTITFVSPVNNQTGVPSDANVSLDISDSGSGVDINKVIININGTNYTANSPGVSFTGNSSLFHFTIKPLTPLSTNSINTVLVNATDLAGNSKTKSINFNLPSPPILVCITPTPSSPIAITPTPTSTSIPTDDQSPTIEFISPLPKQTVSLNPTIKFNVSDPQSGIDFNSIKLFINDQTITFDSPQMTSTGSKFSTNISYSIKNNLIPDTDYVITVFVSDLSGNSLSKSITVHSTTPFITKAAGTISRLPSYLPLLLLLILISGLIFYFIYLLSKLGKHHEVPIGTVFNSQTLEPIPNLRVSAYDKKNRHIKSTLTNIYGIFAFELEPGQYKFVIDHQSSDYFTITSSNNEFIDLPYASHQPLHDDRLPEPLNQLLVLIGVKLPPHGFVFGSDSHLQTQIEVNLVDPKTKNIIAKRITDGLGRYRFIVPHGHYLVTIPNHPTSDFTVDNRHLTQGYTVINQNIFL